MPTLVNQTQPSFVRWLKKFMEKNRAPSKWYEHENCGVH